MNHPFPNLVNPPPSALIMSSRSRRSTANYGSALGAEDLAHEEEVDAQAAAIAADDEEVERNQAEMDEADEDYTLSSQDSSSSQATVTADDEEDEDTEECADNEDPASDDVTEWEAPSSSPHFRNALVVDAGRADEDDEHGSDSWFPSGW